jgi:hypothetical protein
MIVSASYRTDIPAFYGDWFRRRLAEGFVRVANPYGGRPYAVSLRAPDCDGFVFWTRNIAPFKPALAEVAARGLPFVVHMTITGYPRALESSVVEPARAIEDMHWLASTYGPRVAVWRYDPVLMTALTDAEWHRETFARMTGLLRGASDEVVLSFAQIYAKTRANLDRAAARHGFTWRDPDAEEKIALLSELATIAAQEGLHATLCSQPDLLGKTLAPARCIDAARLSDSAGHDIAAKTKGNRPGCLCAQSRDIGAYDTCPHGCTYCYAVRRPELAKKNFRAQDPSAPMLGRASAKAPAA